MKWMITCYLFVFFASPCFSQEEKKDSTIILDEVIVRSFEQNKPLRSVITPVHIISLKNNEVSTKGSLITALNTAPGVRMEERSPGSYRINIRGSSLRSPFGVRNVKVYWNDIPITDAGGNTYFNQFAWNNISSIEIFKGPASSMYGSGTGGLILMNPFGKWEPGVNVELMGGTDNLQNLFINAGLGNKDNMTQLSLAHNHSDGYREHSSMSRENLSWVSKLKLTDRQQFSASILYTDLYYQTPGALTLAEYNTNPKASRPAGGGFPSAVNAKAAIKQTNFLAGFSHFYKMTTGVSNQTSFFGSFTEVNNPRTQKPGPV